MCFNDCFSWGDQHYLDQEVRFIVGDSQLERMGKDDILCFPCSSQLIIGTEFVLWSRNGEVLSAPFDVERSLFSNRRYALLNELLCEANLPTLVRTIDNVLPFQSLTDIYSVNDFDQSRVYGQVLRWSFVVNEREREKTNVVLLKVNLHYS